MQSSPNQPWQFTLRQMLLVTALIAVLLLIFVKYPILLKIALVFSIPAVFVIALFHAANIVTSESHPHLSLFSWSAFGAYFWAYSIEAWRATQSGHGVIRSARGLIWIMVACGAICVYKALRAAFRMRRMRRSAVAESHDPRDS